MLQAASTTLDRQSREVGRVKESSWAEMTRSIDAARKQLPWKPSDFVPPVTVSLRERKARERDVDVVTQTFRDPGREDMAVTMKSTFESKLLARRDDLKKNKFNIINHEGPPRRIDADPQFALARSMKDRGKPYNLLSHLKRDDHKAVSLRYLGNYPHLMPRYIDEEDPFDQVERMKKPKPRPDFNRDPGREYNIVSTKFRKNDEERQQAIDEAIKKKVTDKYWKTHDFDFLRIAYLDAEKEKTFLEAREAAKPFHGQAQLARHPPVVKLSEGQNYNIINNVVTNEERLLAGALKGQVRAMNRMKKTAVEQAAALAGDDEARTTSDRRLKRITYKSWEGPLQRGYSLVNNTLHGDADAFVYLPHPAAVPGTWDRLSVQLDGPARPVNKVDMYASGSNFFGTHDGTGLNARRAHTSLPAPVPAATRPRDLSGPDAPAAYPPRSTLRPLTETGKAGTAPVPALPLAAAMDPPSAQGQGRQVRTGGGLASM